MRRTAVLAALASTATLVAGALSTAVAASAPSDPSPPGATPGSVPGPPEGDANMSLEDILNAYESQPPGVAVREGTSLRYAVQVPDLIGVKDRSYLDHTGLVRHRSIGDLMRYAALNQDTQQLARYGDIIPEGRGYKELPDPKTQSRYSDEQLYALA